MMGTPECIWLAQYPTLQDQSVVTGTVLRDQGKQDILRASQFGPSMLLRRLIRKNSGCLLTPVAAPRIFRHKEISSADTYSVSCLR